MEVLCNDKIGLEKAIKQATENDFPREDIIGEIFNSSGFSLAEVKDSDSIQSELIKINDLLLGVGTLLDCYAGT